MPYEKELFVPKYRELFDHLFVVIILYLYLFQPPFISKYIFITLEIGIIIFYSLFINKYFISKFIASFKNEAILITFILIFCVLRDLVAGEKVYSFRLLTWSFQSFIFGFYIISLIDNYNRKTSKFICLFNLFYWTVFVASLLTLLMFLSPSFDSFYRSFGIEDIERYDSFEQRYRLFGISENLAFTYAYVLGFFGGYTLLILKKNFTLIIPFFLFTLGVMLNARIGFLAIIFYVIYLFFIKRDTKSIVTICLFVSVILLFVNQYFEGVVDLLTFNKNWVMEFFYEISDLLFGTNYLAVGSGTIETLTTSFVIWPDNLFQWILGRGESLFLKQGMNSDVGFILQLNYGGIIFVLQLMVLMTFLFYRLYKNLGIEHWFFLFFFFSFFLLNSKGFIFAATPGGRLLFLLYVYFILRKKAYII